MKNFEYQIKCKKCGKIATMHFGSNEITTKEAFLIWINEHSTFPIQKQCSCNQEMIMLHELIGYGNILDLI